MTPSKTLIRAAATSHIVVMASCLSLTALHAEDNARQPFKGKLLVEGLVGHQVAAKPLLDNPNSFAIDEKGRFYVVESPRLRDGAIIDIRGARQFTLKDFTLQTVEERRQMLLADKTKDQYTRSSDRVALIEDTNGDGTPDKRHDYVADGLGEAEDGLAFSALTYDNQVFLTCIPHVWKFQDRDGDGKAEVREKLLSGFGVAISMMGHDMHGIVRGPDGRLYWSIGDRGFNVVNKEGVRFKAPSRGAIFRSEPDGSRMEVFFHGLRNPQEIAFDEFGNLMTFDNTGDFGDIARVVYAMEGGDAGWYKEHQAPHQYKWAFPDNDVMTSNSRWTEENMFRPDMDEQPQWQLSPVANFQNGPSGIVYAAGESLPDSLRGSFLVCNYRGDANNCGILSFKLAVDGAGFKLRDKDPLTVSTGIGASDLDIGYDGRIYLLDFGGGWSANDRGAIHAVEWPPGLQKPSVQEAKALFAEGFKQRKDLQKLLGHADMRVRQRAQFELVERKDSAALLQTLAGTDGLHAKLHALWGLGQLHRYGKGDFLAKFLAAAAADEVELRVAACRILGDVQAPTAAKVLLACLGHDSRRVQSHAAIALGKMKHKDAAPALWAALKKNDASKDRYLRIAIVNALAAVGDEAGAVAQAGAAEREARLGAVLVLRQLNSGQVARFRNDADKVVRTSALGAIYDNRITAAYPEAMKLTAQAADYHLTSQRRILVINFLQGGVDGAKGVLRMVADPKVHGQVREQGMALLLRWNNLPEFDLINNDHAPLADRNETIYPGIHDELSAFLENEKSPLLAKGLDLAKQVGMKMSGKLLAAQALNDKTEMATRLSAIKALSAKEDDFKGALPDLMKLPEEPIKATLLDLHFKLKLDGRMALAESALTSKSPERIRVAIKHLIKAEGASERFGKLWNDRASALPAATHLDLHLAMKESDQDALKKTADTFSADAKNVQGLTLEGGSAAKGETIFRGSGACVQCHMVNNQGGIQGPALDDVGSRSDRATLLESIITPNAKIAEGFGTMTLTTKSGETFAGILKSEKNGKVELLLPSNEKKTIPVSDIVKRDGPVSAMPPLGVILPPTDLRDLIEFLSQRKAKDGAKTQSPTDHGGK
jgi:quinoprotein glucose dehydrogenase